MKLSRLKRFIKRWYVYQIHDSGTLQRFDEHPDFICRAKDEYHALQRYLNYYKRVYKVDRISRDPYISTVDQANFKVQRANQTIYYRW